MTPTSTSSTSRARRPNAIRAAYSADDWDRLVRLKAHYDPNNVFRFNRNIPLDPRPIQPTESEYDR